jgi:hypothetical protein
MKEEEVGCDTNPDRHRLLSKTLMIARAASSGILSRGIAMRSSQTAGDRLNQ